LQNLLLCRKTTLSDFDKSEDGDFWLIRIRERKIYWEKRVNFHKQKIEQRAIVNMINKVRKNEKKIKEEWKENIT
jgi:hypothetical protein